MPRRRALSRSTLDALWSLATGLLLLAKGLWDNRALFGHDLAPLDDAAADMLLSERMHHGLLLTGHYNFIGVYHPGPFLFYIRWLFEPLAPLVGTVHLTHLIAMMALDSAFFALIAVMALRLTRDDGVGRGAVLAGLCAIPLQLSGADWYATLFIPHYLPLPTAAFILAVILLARGSAFGLVAATVLTAILVHAYIPLAPATVLIWALALARGRSERRRLLGRGFTPATWVGCAAIIGLFILPLALDAILNPPGNIVAIFQAAMTSPHTADQHPLGRAAALALGKCLLPRDFMVPLLLVGIVLAVRRRRFQRLWREILTVSALLMGLEIALLSHNAAGVRPYMLDFGAAPLLLALLLSTTMIVAEVQGLSLSGGARALPAAMPWGIAGLTLALASTTHSSTWFSKEVSPFVTAIVDRSRPGDMVTIVNERLYGWQLPLTLMVELDRTEVHSCFEHRQPQQGRRRVLAVAATRERLCAQATKPPDHVFRLDPVAPCPKAAAPSYREGEMGYRAVMAIAHQLGLLRQPPDPTGSCLDHPPDDAIILHCLEDHSCYTLAQLK